MHPKSTWLLETKFDISLRYSLLQIKRDRINVQFISHNVFKFRLSPYVTFERENNAEPLNSGTDNCD